MLRPASRRAGRRNASPYGSHRDGSHGSGRTSRAYPRAEAGPARAPGSQALRSAPTDPGPYGRRRLTDPAYGSQAPSVAGFLTDPGRLTVRGGPRTGVRAGRGPGPSTATRPGQETGGGPAAQAWTQKPQAVPQVPAAAYGPGHPGAHRRVPRLGRHFRRAGAGRARRRVDLLEAGRMGQGSLPGPGGHLRRVALLLPAQGGRQARLLPYRAGRRARQEVQGRARIPAERPGEAAPVRQPAAAW